MKGETDIGGMDLYRVTQTDAKWAGQNDYLKTAMEGKPYAITECGLLPDTAMIARTAFSYCMVWGRFVDNVFYGMPGSNGPGNTPAQTLAFYNHPMVLTRDEIRLPTTAIEPFFGAYPRTGGLTRITLVNGTQLTIPAATASISYGLHTMTGRLLRQGTGDVDRMRTLAVDGDGTMGSGGLVIRLQCFGADGQPLEAARSWVTPPLLQLR